MRSGSTFLGEFFNVHRDCFYQFEPLYAQSKYGGKKLTNYQFLKTRFDCKFEDMYDTRLPWEEIKAKQHLDANEYRGNFIFRYKSRRLCKPPFCKEDYSNESFCSKNCDDVDPQMASKTCSDLIPVIKTIRLTRFNILNGLITDGKYDPKFIFLVRDPRNVYENDFFRDMI